MKDSEEKARPLRVNELLDLIRKEARYLEQEENLTMAGASAQGLLQIMQQEDKAQHIICGFMAVVALQLMIGLLAASLLVLFLGLLKELWDLAIGTGFSGYDIVANLVGVVLALMVLLVGTL